MSIRERLRAAIPLATALAIIIVGLAVLTLGLAIVAEWSLRLSARSSARATPVKSAYELLLDERVHPLYYFSFPTDLKELTRLNNAIVSITPNGFRGDAPESRGTRRLAFMTGGSTVFGYGLPSQETTVTGWLNHLEPSTLYVNAGVMGWNSTQEFYRLSMELVNYRPSLVISLSGVNDAGIGGNYFLRHRHYPKGTPRYYDTFERRIEAHGWDHLEMFRKDVAFSKLFPYLSGWLSPPHAKPPSQKPLSRGGREDAGQAAQRYVQTLALMRTVANSVGARFVAILQPTALMCEHLPRMPPDVATLKRARIEYIQEFYRQAIQQADRLVELWDMSCIFDRYPDAERTLPLFSDAAHLTPEGDRIVAEEILTRLGSTPRR